VAERANVIAVDFQGRRRLGVGWGAPAPVKPPTLRIGTARQALERARVFVFFWRPPVRGGGGEYLGGRWDWGWTMFAWTSDAAVGAAWTDLVEHRRYVPERLTRDAFQLFLKRAYEVGGILVDGELDEEGTIIRADADQLVSRDEAITILRR